MSRFYRLALVGDPVEHSRSPVMQREALRLSGLEGDYELIRADRHVFVEVVERLRSGDLDGVNVTMPLKSDAFELADVVTDEARGSVNTMRNRKGQIEGHSTDVVAFAELFSVFADALLILGSGGSARAALTAWTGAHVFVSARNSDRVAELAGPVGATVVPWGTGVPGALVVNATPLGMSGEHLPEEVLNNATGLIDLPYGDLETPAVGYARAGNIRVVDGLEFLGIQAAASFTWWTGAVVDSMLLVETARNI